MYRYLQHILLGLLIISNNSSVFAEDRREAFALFEGVRQNLKKYECFRVCYTETRNETGQTVSQVVDFDHGKMRKEHLQNNEDFLGWVAVVNDTDFCSFQRNIEHEDAKLDGPRSRNAEMSGLYDPRILWFHEIHAYEASYLKRIPTNLIEDKTAVQIENIKIGDVRIKKILITDETKNTENGYWEYWISEPQFQVWKIKLDVQGIYIEISSKYDDPKLGPFPSEIHVKRSSQDGDNVQTTHDRVIKVTSFEEKESYPPETFTYQSMDLPLNTAIVDYRIKRRLGYWDGEKLVDDPVSVSAQELRELMKPKEKRINYLLMLVGALLILWALRLAFKQNAKQEKK